MERMKPEALAELTSALQERLTAEQRQALSQALRGDAERNGQAVRPSAADGRPLTERLRAPSLGPQVEAVAQAVMQAADAPPPNGSSAGKREITARLDRDRLRKGHEALQEGHAIRPLLRWAWAPLVLAAGALLVIGSVYLRPHHGAGPAGARRVAPAAVPAVAPAVAADSASAASPRATDRVGERVRDLEASAGPTVAVEPAWRPAALPPTRPPAAPRSPTRPPWRPRRPLRAWHDEAPPASVRHGEQSSAREAARPSLAPSRPTSSAPSPEPPPSARTPLHTAPSSAFDRGVGGILDQLD